MAQLTSGEWLKGEFLRMYRNEVTFDSDELAPQSNQPILLTMTCLNGYFHFPFFDSLSEKLVKADGKGAIAAFSPRGMSLNAPAPIPPGSRPQVARFASDVPVPASAARTSRSRACNRCSSSPRTRSPFLRGATPHRSRRRGPRRRRQCRKAV